MSAPHKSPFAPTNLMLRQFGGLWIVFFGGIAVFQELRHQNHTVALVLTILAVTVGPLGIVWPRAIRPIFIGWMAIAFPIGWVVSHVILTTIFYGLFTPIALAFRLIGRDELLLKPQPTAATYWRSKSGSADKSRYFRQF